MIERVRLNDESILKKQRRSVSKNLPESNISNTDTVRLPPELNFGLDRRTGVGKSTHRRLLSYVRQITNNGKRPLRAAEVTALKVVILLEQKIDAQLDPYHQGTKLDADELRGISSELRRQLRALGLDGADAAHESTPDSKERKSRKLDDEGWVEKLCKRIEIIARHGRANQEPVPDKVSTRKRRRVRKQRKQKRPAPKPKEQEEDQNIRRGVRRNGAWFPSDRYPRDV